MSQNLFGGNRKATLGHVGKKLLKERRKANRKTGGRKGTVCTRSLAEKNGKILIDFCEINQ